MASEKFSVREIEILSRAWECLESEPKVNMEKLANLCGYTNTGSAMNAWRGIRKKLTAIANGDSSSSGTKTSLVGTPKTPGKRSKAVTDDCDDEAETPSKKPKRQKGKGAKSKLAEQNDDVEESAEGEESVIKKEIEGDDSEVDLYSFT